MTSSSSIATPPTTASAHVRLPCGAPSDSCGRRDLAPPIGVVGVGGRRRCGGVGLDDRRWTRLMRRGEVGLLNLQPARGGEADKRRPAVIVSNDGTNVTVER